MGSTITYTTRSREVVDAVVGSTGCVENEEEDEEEDEEEEEEEKGSGTVVESPLPSDVDNGPAVVGVEETEKTDTVEEVLEAVVGETTSISYPMYSWLIHW